MSYSKQQLVCLEQLLIDIQSTLRTIEDSEQYDSLKDKCSILDLDYTINNKY